MKANRFVLFLALALGALFLSACGTPVAASWPGLAASEEAAYLAAGPYVYAVRLEDGEELWRFPEKADGKLQFYSNPVLTNDGLVLLGSSGTGHNFIAVDAETGNEDWSFTGAQGAWQASPLVVDNLVYAPNTDGFLYVFDLSLEGGDKLAWSLELDGPLWARPATDGQYIYVTSLDHRLYAVDPQTESVAWTLELNGAAPGTPAIAADGMLFVGTFGKSIQAVDTARRAIAWSIPTQGWVWGGPLLVDEVLYVGDLEGNFYSFNAGGKPDGEQFQPDGPILASPLVIGEQVIFVTENGTVYAAENGTEPKSLEKMEGKLYTAPVAAGDLILVAPFQGEFLLVALDQQGKQAWTFMPGN